MYRRRDSQQGRTAYSSADAYRALNSPSHADSSEDEAQLKRNSNGTAGITPIAEQFRRRSNDVGRSTDQLSPPRPFFVGADARSSWSASSETSATGEHSDSDGSPPAPAPVVPKPTAAARSSSRTRSGSNPARAGGTSTVVPQPTAPISPTNPRIRARNHRRRSSMANEYSPDPDPEPAVTAVPPTTASTASNPFDTPTNSFYGAMPAGAAAPAAPAGVRPPPSAFPFQSHPGNPDPGTPIPGTGRRASIESLRAREAAHQYSPNSPNFAGTAYPMGAGAAGYGLIGSSSDYAGDLGRPYAPFMDGGVPSREGSATPPSPGASQNRLYMNSAAAAMAGSSSALNQYGPDAAIPRTQSSPAINMRAPFLSPSSRPSSSLWSPPAYYPYPPAASTSHTTLPRKAKAPMPSSRLSQKLSKEDKPWLKKRDCRDRASWWLTFLMMWLGIGGAGVLCFFGWQNVELLDAADLCMVLDESFDTLDLENTWTREVELGGFGNGEFQMATASDDNLFVQNGQLYILPTLTSDSLGRDAILDGGKYSLDGCTSTNKTACSVSSNAKTGATIQPVMSARINTKNSVTIAYGKVEVRAKLPRGDWLWPAIWLLPKDDAYGAWPLSGEIDIMEARGNSPDYPAQGVNFVRSTLNYGVLQSVQTHIFGWWSQKQSSYDKAFHTYALEWTPDWIRFYVDSRLQAMMNLKITGKGGKDFFTRGNYPATATNGSSVAVVVENIWEKAGGTPAAPFDQEFYLILDVAAGGTSGWFPDNVGGKPWFDGSSSAMRDFANAQDTWAATWPGSEDDRALRIDSVKMWKLGSC